MKKIATPIIEAAKLSPANYNNKPAMNDDVLRRRIDEAIQPLSKSRKRIVLHLGMNGRKATGALRAACSIGNISDAVSHINPALADAGLKIINYPPKVPFTNAYGEKTQMHYWELVAL